MMVLRFVYALKFYVNTVKIYILRIQDFFLVRLKHRLGIFKANEISFFIPEVFILNCATSVWVRRLI